MSDLQLNADRDLDVTNQQLWIVDNSPGVPAAIAQELGIALLFVRGEWSLNVLVGLPYRELILGQRSPGIGALTTLYTRATRSVPGIAEVLQMTPVFDNANRLLDVDYKARAQDGGVIEDKLPVNAL